MKQVLLLLVFSLILFVNGDMYLQSVRGSNNRLNEANRERNNANRMFDSQNNNRGGYNVGKINIYENEIVPLAWTNQHGCNGPDTKHCEVIVQAMCDPLMRDGETTQRIPENPAQCQNFNCDLDVKYGRQESYAWYQQCKQTERNQGLFLASQKLKGTDATKTRQNPAGNRYGYECPEERDYYPYWRPTPWRDVVIFTNDPAKCAKYQAESENVKPRSWCELPEGFELKGNQRIPIDKEKCESDEFSLSEEGKNTTHARWMTASPNGWPAPDCIASEVTRPNHLGLIGHRKQWTYNWQVPEVLKTEGVPEATCVLRFRYNITNDYDASPPNAETAAYDTLEVGEMDWKYNSANGGNANNAPSTWPVWEKYGLTDEDVKCSFRANQNNNNCNREEDSRDYVFRNNPQVDVDGRVHTDSNGNQFRLKLQLAINTAQYSRTFQDRTHTFQMHHQPSQVGEGQKMMMVTVGGKRGNIVQTFPGHEYFMYPEVTHLKVGDWWKVEISGSDTNPNNNDGQGRAGTDRSNICPLKGSNYVGGQTWSDASVVGAIGNNYPAYVERPEGYNIPEITQGKPRTLQNGDTEAVTCNAPDQFVAPMGGMPQEAASAICTGKQQGSHKQDYGDMEELDDMGTNLNYDPIQMTKTGCWSYVSTRNNNFSNRCQKATLCVDEGQHAENDIGQNGGAVTTTDGWLAFTEGTLDKIYAVTFESFPSDDSVSPMIAVNPEGIEFADGESAELGIAYEHRAMRTPKVMFKSHSGSDYEKLDDVEFTTQNGQTVAIVQIASSGFYKVQDDVNVGAVAGIVIALVFLIVSISTATYYRCCKKPASSDDYTATIQA